MRTLWSILAVLFLVAASPLVAGERASWSQWRGPLATGEAPGADPPIAWSETQNLRWKVALPGKGHSTPVIWGERIFLTTAVPVGEEVEPHWDDAPGAHDNLPTTRRHEFVVLAVDRDTGAILWRRAVRETLPPGAGHVSASLASASPVTDGERVYAFFGSQGLYALRVADGEVAWSKDFGRLQAKHAHGEGSSPVLHGDTLVVNWDHEGDSFLIALDARTGEQRWRMMRDEVTSWATPIVVEHDGKAQVIVSGTERLRAYDLKTGAVIWQHGGLSGNVVASPVAGLGMVFAGSSYEKQALLAIRLDGAVGEITGTEQLAWSLSRLTPYVPSPLLYDGSLFFLRHYQPILSRIDAATGAERGGPFRLTGLRNIYASPVAAAGRIYITDREGTTLVLANDESLTVLAANSLDDVFSASAVLVDRELYLRGERFLYRIEEASPALGDSGEGEAAAGEGGSSSVESRRIGLGSTDEPDSE